MLSDYHLHLNSLSHTKFHQNWTFFTKISRFTGFKNGGCLPFWVFEICNFCNVTFVGITLFLLQTHVCILSYGINTAPQSFYHLFITLSMICCSKSAKKSAVQMCKVATVVTETTQLVISQLKNLLYAVHK